MSGNTWARLGWGHQVSQPRYCRLLSRCGRFAGFGESDENRGLSWVESQVSKCAPRARGDGPAAIFTYVVTATVLPAPAGMVPGKWTEHEVAQRAPRARGDGPACISDSPYSSSCSPRPRGWSRRPAPGEDDAVVLPAPAGMVPRQRREPAGPRRAPRARGDGPPAASTASPASTCSPRPRGWSPCTRGWRQRRKVLPAPAGMVPPARRAASAAASAPRARGDGPVLTAQGPLPLACSPRPRGWSQRLITQHFVKNVLPAPAGMVPRRRPPPGVLPRAPRARGDGPYLPVVTETDHGCSPRPRGWSHQPQPLRARPSVLPAPAGMVPATTPGSACRRRAPRARGDGPPSSGRAWGRRQCSPRPRGWSRLAGRPRGARRVLPAPAGMVPILASRVTPAPMCSPRPRGWSHPGRRGQSVGVVLPAPAGMVPPPARPAAASASAPRARGDGPLRAAGVRAPGVCSPRPRGWSLGVPVWQFGDLVLPAPAGVVPARARPSG